MTRREAAERRRSASRAQRRRTGAPLRRPAPRALSGPRPDRVAAWAVVLGLFMVLVASATSRGATGGAVMPPEPAGGTNAQATLRLADGTSVAPTDLAAVVARMTPQVATWYGPGLYGRKTACGQRLRRSTRGVAHRRLPCGELVSLYHAGRLVTVPVIDRGPHVRGVAWDLAAGTARDLGFRRTGPIRILR